MCIYGPIYPDHSTKYYSFIKNNKTLFFQQNKQKWKQVKGNKPDRERVTQVFSQRWKKELECRTVVSEGCEEYLFGWMIYSG